MSKFKIGDTVYLYDHAWIRVKIIRVTGNYYHVKRLDYPVAFGASEHRLLSEKEYLATVGEKVRTNFAPPWLH